jgi:hypothetical protein
MEDSDESQCSAARLTHNNPFDLKDCTGTLTVHLELPSLQSLYCHLHVAVELSSLCLEML